MENLGILNNLTERQLAEVTCAVAKWKESGEPGIFGFVSESDLNEKEELAIQLYKKDLLTKTAFIAVPVLVITTVGVLGYYKIKNRNNKKQI